MQQFSNHGKTEGTEEFWISVRKSLWKVIGIYHSDIYCAKYCFTTMGLFIKRFKSSETVKIRLISDRLKNVLPRV